MAVTAWVLDDLAGAMAAAAGRLIDHPAERRILHRLARTRTMAVRAVLRTGSRCSTGAMTGLAVLRTRNTEFHFLAESGFLKRDLQIIAQITAALRSRTTGTATAALTAKEHIEYIAKTFGTATAKAAKTTLAETTEAAGTAAHTAIECRMTELVILGLLLRVLQDIIGFIDFFELLFGCLGVIAVQVWMIFAGHLLIGLLQFSF